MNDSFGEKLIGHYLNTFQAFSEPSRWPQIHITYTRIKDNELELKQWYNYQSEDNPYRHYHIKYEYVDESNVITYPINQQTLEPSCRLKWEYDDGSKWWTGTVDGECIMNNARVVSFIQFNGDLYHSLDTGYDPNTGEFVWGTEPGSGVFEFERVK